MSLGTSTRIAGAAGLPARGLNFLPSSARRVGTLCSSSDRSMTWRKLRCLRAGGRRQALLRLHSRGFPQILLGLADDLLHSKKTVGAHRDGIDAMLNQETRKFWMVARRLAANAGMPAALLCLGEQLGDSHLHGFVFLVEQAAQHVAVTINAEHQLGEIVGADGVAVEPLGELFG